METNEAKIERILRVVLGPVLIYAGIAQIVTTGVLTYVIALFGLTMFTTGVIGYCPLYTVIGINNYKVKEK